MARDMHETTGAVVLGRRIFDVGSGSGTILPSPCHVSW